MPPKNSKKSTAKPPHRTKPLTDYFQVKPTDPDAPNNTLSTPVARLAQSLTRLQGPSSPPPQPDSETTRLSPPLPDTLHATPSLRKSPRLAVAHTPDPIPSSQMAPFSSPLSLHGGKCAPKSAASSKRKSTFGSDTEMDTLDVLDAHPTVPPTKSLPTATPLSSRENLVWNASQRKPSRHKKARLSPPLTASASEKGELVPTSHSSEREELLPLPSQRDVRSVIEHVDTWRKHAALPSPSSPKSTPGMQTPEVDIILPDAADVCENPHTPVPSHPSTPVLPFALTPPLTSSPDLPRVPTPVILDAATKTAQIIADIKARAYASTPSSPEPEKPEWKEQLDDSDDELPSTFYDIKGKAPMTFPIDDASNPMGPDCTMSSPLSSPASSRASSQKRRRVQPSRVVPSRAPVVLTTSTTTALRPKKKVSVNPLDALLREKRKADLLGRGESAFRRAESALVDQADDDMRWDDEASALATVEERKGVNHFSDSNLFEHLEDFTLDVQDRKRLLGEERSVAVGALLDHDKLAEDDRLDMDLGMPLWLKEDDFQDLMDVDATWTVPVVMHGHPILQLLVDSVASRAYDQAKTILDSGLLAELSVSQPLIDILLGLALQSDQQTLSTAAFRLLSELWSQRSSPTFGLSLHLLASHLISFGANPQVLLEQGVQVSYNPQIGIQYSRNSALLKLVTLFTLSARKIPLPLDDVPSTLVLLLLVASDPRSANELRVAVIVGITAICESFAPDGTCVPSVESKLCSFILKYCQQLHPKNQAFLLSFLTAGSDTPRRIASWVANSLLLGRLEVLSSEYSRVPPLEGLKALLSSTTPGAFELTEDTNYITMGHHVKLLAAAIYDVEGYMESERKNIITKSPSSEKTPQLSFITAAIDLLHDQITDTRAAHLDRSRTKAALKAVGRRIYYQANTAFRSLGRSKSTLRDYFG